MGERTVGFLVAVRKMRFEYANPYRSPNSDLLANDGGSFDSRHLLFTVFGFNGRIPRRVWWIAMLLVPVVLAAAVQVALLTSQGDLADFLILAVPVTLAFWIALSVHVRRFHDRGKSAWWLLVGFIPAIGPLWLFIELGFCRGTMGANRYGLEPS
ncbi:MAG: DUF805 domain-containing protein [Bryobacterales bacterium]|nr:DUF805 domain-containing protein [Bryobacterales bacterium]